MLNQINIFIVLYYVRCMKSHHLLVCSIDWRISIGSFRVRVGFFWKIIFFVKSNFRKFLWNWFHEIFVKLDFTKKPIIPITNLSWYARLIDASPLSHEKKSKTIVFVSTPSTYSHTLVLWISRFWGLRGSSTPHSENILDLQHLVFFSNVLNKIKYLVILKLQVQFFSLED